MQNSSEAIECLRFFLHIFLSVFLKKHYEYPLYQKCVDIEFFLWQSYYNFCFVIKSLQPIEILIIESYTSSATYNDKNEYLSGLVVGCI